jgi:fructose-bisphosphate aldolase class II
LPLVNMKDLLSHAYRHRYAVAAFQVPNLEFLAGYLRAAERAHSPLILNVPQSSCSGIGPSVLLPTVESAAQGAQVPVAILADHADDLPGTVEGIRLGCNGVMIDGSHLAFMDNVALTSEVVKMAHACDIPVEGELGCIPDASATDGLRLTSVEEAKAFVQRTGVDFLAVSVGTAHGRHKGKPRMDSGRLRQINQALSIPLVIHGGSGLDESQIQGLVANGAAKINFFTAIDESAGQAITSEKGRYTERVREVAETIARETENHIRFCGAAGRAAEVLTQCRPAEPVEHLIIYNLSPGFEDKIDEVMAKGRDVLSQIPGVRHVLTGYSVQEDAKFKFCWLIRFVSPAVIPSYRDHPAHVAYANSYFRPYAENRISIDYLLR